MEETKMNEVYNNANENEMKIEEMVVEHTTPEQILAVWQEAQAWKEAHNMGWDEFVSLMVGR
jgi:hypothetical protein